MSERTTQAHLCPQCGKEALMLDNVNFPFCSERCRLLDLGAWASEKYRIIGESPETEDENSSLPEKDNTSSEDT